MTLERGLGLFFLIICLVYGYTAFFLMDDSLAPFMKFSPVWPSSFPKILAVLGTLVSLSVIVNSGHHQPKDSEIDYRRLTDYKLFNALALLGLMFLYATCLRPVGFIFSTIIFLTLAGYILGERNLKLYIPIASVTAVSIWYLVQEVLGIYLLPLPWVMVS